MSRTPYNMSSSQPHVLLAVSATTAGASAASWAVDHAAWFTIAAGTAAVLSGIAAFVFYIVSTYYKIKNAAKDDA